MFSKNKANNSKQAPVVEKKKRDKGHLQPPAPQTELKTTKRYMQERKNGISLANSTTESKRKFLTKHSKDKNKIIGVQTTYQPRKPLK